MPATWKRPWHFAWTLERQDLDGVWHATMDTRLAAQRDDSPAHLAFLDVLDHVLRSVQRAPIPRLPLPGWCPGTTPWSLAHMPVSVSGPGQRSYMGQTRLWGVGEGFSLPASAASWGAWARLLQAGEDAMQAEGLPPCWRTSPHAMTAHARMDAVHAHRRLAPHADTTLRLLVQQTPTSWGDMAGLLGFSEDDTP